MAELRFPRRGRAARRPETPETPSDPLEAMAGEIRALDAAATNAAERIKQAAAGLEEGSGQSKLRVELMGGVATALVERTDQIRADCERLSSLMDRTAKLVAARDAEAAGTTPTPAPTAEATSTPPPAPVSHLDLPRPEPVEPEPEEAAPRPRWLERDDQLDTSQTDEGGTSEGVRLIATQMAIAGSSRSEIEHRLRIQFGVVDAEKALDDIFGNRRSGVQ